MVEEPTDDYLQETVVDWYNNDGWFSELVINIQAGTVSLNIDVRYTESTTEFYCERDIMTCEEIWLSRNPRYPTEKGPFGPFFIAPILAVISKIDLDHCKIAASWQGKTHRRDNVAKYKSFPKANEVCENNS